MKLLESAALVAQYNELLKTTSAELIDSGLNPHLAVVLVGDNEDSLRYIDVKTRRGKACGIIVSVYHLEAQVHRTEISKTLDYLSNDPDINGIILQLPLPGKWQPAELSELISHISPEKDVDGLRGDWVTEKYSGATQADLAETHTTYLPPMVAAVCLLLDFHDISLSGKNIVIVGKGRLVGEPLYHFFSSLGLQVQTVDEHTSKIIDTTKNADIIISGTGTKDLITYQWVKEGAVVMDCAFDVHRDSVDQIASAVAPSKGGLGPLTVTWLLYNTLEACKKQVVRLPKKLTIQ